MAIMIERIISLGLDRVEKTLLSQSSVRSLRIAG
jgi:hypothetical protein